MFSGKELVCEYLASHGICLAHHFRAYSASKVIEASENSDTQSLFQVNIPISVFLRLIQIAMVIYNV